MGVTLETADALRETSPANALEAYAQVQDEIRADDHDRILWICDQVAPTPPPALHPLFERVQREGPALLGRAALHAAATCAWYEGRGEEAEQMWSKGLREPGDRDRYWIRSCLNLAMVMQLRQCLFEPLVLSGMGRRAGQALDRPYLVAYAALRRAELLLKMGAVERARPELDIAQAAQPRVEKPNQRAVIDYEAIRVRAAYLEFVGDRKAALQARDEELALLEARPGKVEAAVMVATLMARLDLRYAEYVEEREDVLRAYDRMPEELTFGPYWQEHWKRRRTERFLQHAVEQGDKESAAHLAGKLLALIREDPADSRKMLIAARLGRLLAQDLDDAATSKEAFDIASQACLNRIVEADRASREIPELADATPDDWEALREYRKRLANEQRELLRSVAENLKPGAAAFDLIVRDDAIRVCAWCSRVHTADGAWQPLMHFVPDRATQMLTHAICETCMERTLADG